MIASAKFSTRSYMLISVCVAVAGLNIADAYVTGDSFELFTAAGFILFAAFELYYERRRIAWVKSKAKEKIRVRAMGLPRPLEDECGDLEHTFVTVCLHCGKTIG